MLLLEIELSRGHIAYVDECDFIRVLSRRWAVSGGKYGPYAMSSGGVSMHRFVMGLGPYATDKRIVDHIRPNSTLDNRRSNLRIADGTSNQWNRGPNRNNTTGFKGVTWHKKREKYGAHIYVFGKAKHLGWFDCPIAASERYKEEARKFQGEFARFE